MKEVHSPWYYLKFYFQLFPLPFSKWVLVRLPDHCGFRSPASVVHPVLGIDCLLQHNGNGLCFPLLYFTVHVLPDGRRLEFDNLLIAIQEHKAAESARFCVWRKGVCTPIPTPPPMKTHYYFWCSLKNCLGAGGVDVLLAVICDCSVTNKFRILSWSGSQVASFLGGRRKQIWISTLLWLNLLAFLYKIAW